jgi:hypothetical protein
MRLSLHTLTAVLVAVTVAACSSSPQARPAAVNQRVISADELRASTFTNVYEMIEAMRPQWLRPRGRTTFNGSESVKVYLDGSLLGEPSQLRNFTSRSLAEIRWFDANEATQRWGLDHGNGAILLSTRRSEPERTIRP